MGAPPGLPPHPARPRSRLQAPPPGPARRHAWPQPVRTPTGGGAAGGEQASRPSTPRRLFRRSALLPPLSSGTQPDLMGLRMPSFLFPGKLPPSGHYITTPGRLLLLAFQQPPYSTMVLGFYLLPVKSGENQWLSRALIAKSQLQGYFLSWLPTLYPGCWP